MGERFSTFLRIYREEYHERRQLARRPFPRLPLFFFSSLEPRRNSSRVLIRRLFVATAGTSNDPVPPIREFYGSLVGSAEKILEEITTMLEIGATKLIHRVDKRHNFHARREKQFYRRVNYALFFSFFQLYIEIGRAPTYFIVRHIPE